MRTTKIDYTPSFRLSEKRPWYKRLTPMAWLIIGTLLFLILLFSSLGISSILGARNGQQNLSEALGNPTSKAPVAPAPAQPVAAPKVDPVQAAVSAPPAAAPAASGKVAWADKMTQQSDGTWMAPKEVVQKITTDLSSYYASSRNRTLDSYLTQRDAILEANFSGEALENMKKYEQTRERYGVNKSGSFSLEVKRFAADGLSAQLDVIIRDWTNDVFDVKTKAAVETGTKTNDTLTVMTIRFDAKTGRWKIDKVNSVLRLQK
jgi:hypothetical protein